MRITPLPQLALQPLQVLSDLPVLSHGVHGTPATEKPLALPDTAHAPAGDRRHLAQLIASLAGSRLGTLSPAASQALGALISALPVPADLFDARQWPALIARSGLFHEALGPAAHPQDLKARLLALDQALRTDHPATDTPDSPLARTVDAALADLVQHQLAHVEERGEGQREWFLSWPVRDGERLEALTLHLRHDARTPRPDGEAASPRWVLTLSIALPTHATLAARLTWQDERLAIRFDPEDPAVQRWLAHHTPAFAARLQTLGLGAVRITIAGQRADPGTHLRVDA